MSAPSRPTTCAEAPRLYTAGYEGAGLARFLATLQAARIQLLIDVRARPWSRNPGFTKAALGQHLAAAGIDYLHLEPLGSPDELRAAARADDAYPAGYLRHLETPAAASARAHAADLARSHRVALMCMEADPKRCHRSVLAAHLAETHGFKVEHLSTDPQATFDF